MKKATCLVAVFLAATFSVYGQSAKQITQPEFSSQVFNPQKATRANWLDLPQITTWQHLVKNRSKGRPTWGYIKFSDIEPYLTWGLQNEYWFKTYYSPDAQNLYLYNSGMTRGQKVTVKVLFPGTYYVHFQQAGVLLQLNVAAGDIIANLYLEK